MTTVVYHKDSHSLYADSRATDQRGYIISEHEEKICIRADGLVFALSGSLPSIQHVEDQYPTIDSNQLCGAVQGFVYDPTDDAVYVFGAAPDEQGNYELLSYELTHTQAFGSGMDFATAAMDLGFNPTDAIEYAATRDSSTNTRVSMLDLRKYRDNPEQEGNGN